MTEDYHVDFLRLGLYTSPYAGTQSANILRLDKTPEMLVNAADVIIKQCQGRYILVELLRLKGAIYGTE